MFRASADPVKNNSDDMLWVVNRGFPYISTLEPNVRVSRQRRRNLYRLQHAKNILHRTRQLYRRIYDSANSRSGDKAGRHIPCIV